MSLTSFYFGIAHLVLVVLSLGFAAFRIRARILPSFEGATARLAEAIIAIGSLVVVSELLGLLGLIQGWALVLVSLAGALFCWLRVYPAEAEADLRPPAPPISLPASLLALAVTGVLVAQWAAFTSYGLDHGITNLPPLSTPASPVSTSSS